jgi:hypothetical protein
MIGGLRRVSYTGVLVALAIVVFAGCKATGGGYIPTAAEGVEGKATFAFNAKCTNTTDEFGNVIAEVKGQLQYNDHPADVKIHADLVNPFPDIDIGSSTPCEDFDDLFTDEQTDVFFGVYRVPGGPKEEAEEGGVILEVTDAGEPGINGDQVAISLSGGRYSGYSNSGIVEGGNVQVD